MSDMLIVETPFSELAELVDGLAPRIDGTRITLWSGIDVEEGISIRFSVRLADGSTCFEGTGTCVARHDQGDTGYPSERYEITLDSLELDARNDVVFERLLLAAETGGGRGTGEVDLRDVEIAGGSDFPQMLPSDPPPSMPAKGSSEHTTEMQLDDLEEDFGDSLPPPRQEAAAGVRHAVRNRSSVLHRPSLEASWQPEAVARGASRAGSGLFAYGDRGLPAPPAPPRPDGPQQRVEPAPKP